MKLNQLEVGKTYRKFTETGEMNDSFPIIEDEYGNHHKSTFIASLMLNSEETWLNKHLDEKFQCVLMSSTASRHKIKAYCLLDLVSKKEGGKFPAFKVVAKLPESIDVDIVLNSTPMKAVVYDQHLFGIPIEDINAKFIPYYNLDDDLEIVPKYTYLVELVE